MGILGHTDLCEGSIGSETSGSTPERLAFGLPTDTASCFEEHEEWAGNCFLDVEDLQYYQIGGFHPVYIGDILNSRFKVVHKLGYGEFGTVWLCLDERSKRWRAVKVLQAVCSKETTCAEVMAMKLLHNTDPKELHDNHVFPPLESFWVTGPNGVHACFVMPLLGPKLMDHFRCHDCRGEPAIHLSYQMAKAMKFLHEKGLYHGGGYHYFCV